MNKTTQPEGVSERVVALVRELKILGLSPWEISMNIHEFVNERSIRRWIAGTHTPKNAKAVLKPLENLLKRQQKRQPTITGEKNVDYRTQI